jgi:hypothetical protein
MRSGEGPKIAEGKTSASTFVCVTNCAGANEGALEFAFDLATRHGAHLELVHVIDPSHTPSTPDAQMGIQFRLESLARSLRHIKANVEARLLYGSPEEVIPKRAEEIHAKLIAFLLNGSPADYSQTKLVRRLTRRCVCPVMAISPGMRCGESAGLSSIDNPLSFNKRTREGKGRLSRAQPRAATEPCPQGLVLMMPNSAWGSAP